MKEKKRYYISNEDVGFGKKRNFGTACTSLNEQLALAIACMEFDNIAFYRRLLRDRSCDISRNNQQFLNRFKDD